MMTTIAIAEHMLTTGKHYSAATLGRELGLSAHAVSGKLFNIRTGSRYRCDITALPNRLIKVVAVDGRKHTQQQRVNAFLKAMATKEKAA